MADVTEVEGQYRSTNAALVASTENFVVPGGEAAVARVSSPKQRHFIIALGYAQFTTNAVATTVAPRIMGHPQVTGEYTVGETNAEAQQSGAAQTEAMLMMVGEEIVNRSISRYGFSLTPGAGGADGAILQGAVFLFEF